MKKIKLKRFVITVVIMLACYLLQCTLFPSLELASVKPNLLLIVTAAYGFMRGPKTGMWIGFFSGLLIDIQFGTVLGLYALIYLMIGYVNGLFSETYFDEDIKLPLLLIAGSEFVYGLLIYFLMFMLRGEFDFVYYLMHVIIPELIYTVGVTLILYQLILWINQKLEAEEKRSASKFVRENQRSVSSYRKFPADCSDPCILRNVCDPGEQPVLSSDRKGRLLSEQL